MLVATAFAGNGAQAVERLLGLAATPRARLLIAAAVALALVSVAVARHYRHRFPARLALPPEAVEGSLPDGMWSSRPLA